MIAAEQGAQCRQMNNRAEQRHQQCRRNQRDPETAGRRQDQDADISAQHEQLAMGEIDHVHDAENQGQSRGDERQDHAGDNAVDRLDQQLIERDRLQQLLHRAAHTPIY